VNAASTSARPVTGRLASRADEAVAAAVIVAGVVILAARPFVGGSASARVWLFAASYLAIGLASLAAPAPAEVGPPPFPAALALGIGLGAVALAAAAAGTPVPAPRTAAAAPLALLAAVAEEALFRRVAYARLVRFGAAVAVTGSAALFALVHLPAYGPAALPVDLGAGLLLSWLRWASGTWTVPAAVHAGANLAAVLP
jgi:membrane protease YdiL (CAAX protease family)